MKSLFLLFLIISIVSCASPQPVFNQNKACSKESLRYLKNQKDRKQVHTQALADELGKTQRDIQLCYEDFKVRTGKKEFNTCLVVGVDSRGKTDFYHFSSADPSIDREFISCAHSVTKNVNFGRFGKNYTLVQSYQFYYQ